MIYKLINNEDKILETPTDSFDFDNPIVEPKEFAENLAETMIANKGLGLSAPQCGYNTSVFVVGDPRDKETIMGMFNPKVVDYSEEQILMYEGCLSFPGLLIKIKRPENVRIRFQDMNGETLTRLFTGVSSRAVQHEFDHLQGILFQKKANRVHLESAKNKQKKWARLMKKKGIDIGNNV